MAFPMEFDVTRDSSGAPAYSPYPATIGGRVDLSQNIEQHFNVPAGGYWVINMNYPDGSAVYVGYGFTATNPSGTDTIPCPLKPGARTVPGGTLISLITSDVTGQIVTYEIWNASYR